MLYWFVGKLHNSVIYLYSSLKEYSNLQSQIILYNLNCSDLLFQSQKYFPEFVLLIRIGIHTQFCCVNWRILQFIRFFQLFNQKNISSANITLSKWWCYKVIQIAEYCESESFKYLWVFCLFHSYILMFIVG